MTGTEQFIKADDLEKLAYKIIQSSEIIGHVDINEVLFLRDRTEFKGKALAKCFKLIGHPVQFFTEKKWCVIIYENRTDYMSENQIKLLLLHELMHIPPVGDKMVEHTIQDFHTMLNVDLDWSKPNKQIPDILRL